MADWDGDPSMSQWDEKYVATNLKPASKPYVKAFFLRLNQELATAEEDMERCVFAIIINQDDGEFKLRADDRHRQRCAALSVVQMWLDGSLTR